MGKQIIYQLFVRAFGNRRDSLPGGSYDINGSGKFNDINSEVLASLKELAVTHVWYTGVIAHASRTDWSAFGIPSAHPQVVKGEAGSPYAITDYYDVAAELACSIPHRMEEFSALIERTHNAGLKAIIDFVPNHLSRCYHGASSLPDASPAHGTAEGAAPCAGASFAAGAAAASAAAGASFTAGAAAGGSSGRKVFGAEDDPTQAFSPQNNFYYLVGEELHLPDAAQGSFFAGAGAAGDFAGGDFAGASAGGAAGASAVAGASAAACASAAGAAPYREYPARATGNDCFSAWPSVNDWYDTVKLNYGVDYASGRRCFEPRPKTWGMMLDVLLFWASKGVDGFRCDMAEMVPVEFWHWAIAEVKHNYPQTLFVAEVYNPSLYSSYLDYGGFDLLYDKVGMYDTLKLVSQRHIPASSITGAWQSVDKIQNRMLNFLENHDEQRIASSFNLGSPWRAIPELGVSLLFNRAPFMIYCGQEYGEKGMQQEGFSGLDGRTSIFDYCSIPALVEKSPDSLLLRSIYASLLRLALTESAFAEGYTFDLTYCNPHHSHTKFIFARRPRKTFHNPAPEDSLLIICADFSLDPTGPAAVGSSLALGGSAQEGSSLALGGPAPEGSSLALGGSAQEGSSLALGGPAPAQIDIILPDELFRLWNIPQGAEYTITDLFPCSSAGRFLATEGGPAADVKSVIALFTSLTLSLSPLGLTIVKLARKK